MEVAIDFIRSIAIIRLYRFRGEKKSCPKVPIAAHSVSPEYLR